MIYFVIILISILAFISDRKFNANGKIGKIITRQIANTIFLSILFNFPKISLWHYMRTYDFLAPEILNSENLMNYIGIDFLIINLIVLGVPIILMLGKEKTPKIIGWIFLIIYILIVSYGIYSSPEIALPTILFLLSVGLYSFILYKFLKSILLRKLDDSYWLVSILPPAILISLIILPILHLEGLTGNTLRRMRLGNLDVQIRTDDKRLLTGYLLLKTSDFYYLHPTCNDKIFRNNVVIVSTQNTTLVYPVNHSKTEKEK